MKKTGFNSYYDVYFDIQADDMTFEHAITFKDDLQSALGLVKAILESAPSLTVRIESRYE